MAESTMNTSDSPHHGALAPMPERPEGSALADGAWHERLEPGTSASQNPEFVSRLQRRRVRQYILRLLVFSILIAASIAYLAQAILAPDHAHARLSAQPAPPKADNTPAWRGLVPMNRSFTTHTLAEGSSLVELLSTQNVPPAEAQSAVDELKRIFDTRSFKSGQQIRLFWERPADAQAPDQARFAGLDFIPLPRQHIMIRRLGHQNYSAENFDRPLTAKSFYANTLIERSVYEAARGAGLAPNTVIRLIRLFSYNVDFQRDIREGDRLEVLYTRRFDQTNELAEEGDILYAALTNNGKRIAFWGLKDGTRPIGYFDENGKSAQRLLMKTPVDGARLSSRYGRRRHPILGYTRMHRGLDFAATAGTPIYAAGNGVITRIGKNGSYGNYIRIQHSNGFETAYAHLRRFTRGLKKGSRVAQGDVIGQVGQTGLASGPHLHYEVLQKGKQINPTALDLPSARSLSPEAKQRLAKQRDTINETIRYLTAGNRDNQRASLAPLATTSGATNSAGPNSSQINSRTPMN